MKEIRSSSEAAEVRIICQGLLRRVLVFSDLAWHSCADGRSYFADGSSEENGIRTNTSLLFALAILYTTDSTIDENTKIRIHIRCEDLLAYLCSSHKTGDGCCNDGHQWGLNWQSSWWSSKLGLAAHLLRSGLQSDITEAVERLVVAEANHQLSRIAPTGLFMDTKAEETAWDCEILSVAAMFAPTNEMASVWLSKLREFSLNVFSAPQDRYSNELVDGEVVRRAVYTCNIHGDFSLENHGSYHFCYVASPLISKSYVYAALNLGRYAVPDSLQHHVADVWGLARHTFLTNRFAYIGGQDWARYTYGEYFIIPALSYLDSFISDIKIKKIQMARLRFLETEAVSNSNGTFYGTRFTNGRFYGQYAKYETDTFACIALTILLQSISIPQEKINLEFPEGDIEHCHVSPEGQFCFWRTEFIFFSFAWSHLGRETPTLSFGPTTDDDFFEWHGGNGVGSIWSPGEAVTVGVHSMRRVGETIVICGQDVVRSRNGKPMYERFLNIEFDRSRRQVTVHFKVISKRRLWLVHVAGLSLRIPNDVFNGNRRIIESSGKSIVVASAKGARGVGHKPYGHLERAYLRVKRLLGQDGSRVIPLGVDWVEVDRRVRIEAPAQPIVLRQYSAPQSPWESLWVDQVECPERRVHLNVRAGTVLLDTEFKLLLRTSGASDLTVPPARTSAVLAA